MMRIEDSGGYKAAEAVVGYIAARCNGVFIEHEGERCSIRQIRADWGLAGRIYRSLRYAGKL